MKALAKVCDELFETISKKEKIPKTLDTFDLIKEHYKFIKRPDGKLLNSQDTKALATLLSFLENNKLLVTYEWFEEKLLKSQRTVRRTLQNLGNCFNYKFFKLITIKDKKYYNRILITPTNQLQQILSDSYLQLTETKYKKKYIKHFKNPYKIADTSQQCSLGEVDKLSHNIYKYKRKQEEITTTEIVTTNARAREESKQKIENINQKTLVEANLTEPPKVFCKEPPEPKPQIVSIMSRLEENPMGNATRSGEPHLQVAKDTQYATNNVVTLPKPDDPSLKKLHAEIYRTFGSGRSGELLKQSKFILLGEQKIGIRMSNIELTEEEKKQLRSCIRNVYGEDIKMVALGAKNIDLSPETPEKPVANDKPQNDIPRLPSDIWGLIRKKLIDQLHHGKFIDMNWFSKLEATVDEKTKQLALKAPNIYTKNYVFENYLSDIEELAAKNDFAVGLYHGDDKIHYSNPKLTRD